MKFYTRKWNKKLILNNFFGRNFFNFLYFAILNFPVNESLKILLQKSPVEVWRSEAVERFKSILNEIDAHKSTLEGMLQNGLCQIKDHENYHRI